MVELIRPVLRAVLTAAWVAAFPMIAPAQEPPLPPAAIPEAPQALRQLSPQESLAMAQEHAIVDSIRRLHRERMDSAMRAQRRAVHTRRMAAARYGKPKQSPMFGEAPFFGYTWVFYADILAGTIVGLALFLARQQESDAPVSGWWAVGAMIAGGIGGAGVFVAFFVLAVFASVLAFFGDGLSTIALLGWTLGAMMLPLLSVMVSRRWG